MSNYVLSEIDNMFLTYFGHSAFMIETKDFTILIDPFLKHNPHFDTLLYDAIKPDYILLTHGHGDHVGDTFELAKDGKCTVIAPFELAALIGKYDIRNHPMQIGGSYEFPFGRVKMVYAQHSSSLTDPETGFVHYTGNPCGYILTLDGTTVYHAGDTALFSDMKLYGDMENIDYALLPVGDNFTMGIKDAVVAAELLSVDNVIPMHYNTFDLVRIDMNELKKQFLQSKSKLTIIEFNAKIEI